MFVKDMRTGQIIFVENEADFVGVAPIQHEEEVDEDDFIA